MVNAVLRVENLLKRVSPSTGENQLEKERVGEVVKQHSFWKVMY